MVRVVQASRTARRGPARATPRAGAHPSPRPPPAPRSWRSRKLQVAPPRRRGCRRAREPTQRSPGESLVCLFLDSRTTAAARSSSASSRSRLLASPSLSGATPSLSGATPSRAAIGGSGSISRQSNGAYDGMRSSSSDGETSFAQTTRPPRAASSATIWCSRSASSMAILAKPITAGCAAPPPPRRRGCRLASSSLSGATPSRAAIGGSGSISRQSNGAYDEWGPRPRTAMRRWPTSTGLRAQATTSAFPARRRRPTPSRCCFRYASWMATYGHVI